MARLNLCILYIIAFVVVFKLSASQFYTERCKDFSSPLQLMARKDRWKSIILPTPPKNAYQKEEVCEWRIEAEDDQFIVKLKVVHSAIQGPNVVGECDKDYVDVFDVVGGGSNSFLGRFCGDGTREIFESTGPKMVVKFHSDRVYEFSGFEADYTAVEQGSDASSESSSMDVIYMAVAIPVGLLGLLMLLAFSFAMFRIHRRKHAADRRRQQIMGGLTTDNSRNRREPSPSDISPFVPVSVSSTNISDHSGLQVNLPPENQQGRVYGRLGPRPTAPHVEDLDLPPPYELIETTPPYSHISDIPITPPPYEAVAKEMEEERNQN